MSYEIKFPYALAAVFLWIGFVCAISFMEAWLKFRAPGVTLPIGLGIGKLVFNALNKVEWFFAIVILINLLTGKSEIINMHNSAYLIPVIILLVQTFWLLPELGKRADLYINNLSAPESSIHIVYIALEVVKVISLFVFGVLHFRKII